MKRKLLFRLLLFHITMIIILIGIFSNSFGQNRRPIYITFHSHGHSFNDRLPDPEDEYERHRAEVNWLRETANKYGAKVNFQVNGEYAEWCIHKGHQSEILACIEDGHTIGIHFHTAKRNGNLKWNSVPFNQLTPEYLSQQWEDHYEWVKKIIPGHPVVRLDPQDPDYDNMQRDELMKQLGIKMMAAPEEHIMGYMDHYKIGHHVWNPFRPGAGKFIEEDLSTPYIVIPFLPQIGRGVTSGRHAGLKMTLPHLKRRVLMIYLEWLYQERNNLPDKVWTFGWATHPDQNSRYHGEIEAMWRWMNENFINKRSARGSTVMVYASDEQVLEEYEKWEKENPEKSSFSFREGDSYPYSIPAMQTAFDMAEYDYEISDWKNQGIHCHHLTRNVVDDKTASGVEVWVFWCNFGKQYINVQNILGKQAQVMNIKGEPSIQKTANLEITEDPIFVERYRGIRRER